MSCCLQRVIWDIAPSEHAIMVAENSAAGGTTTATISANKIMRAQMEF
jgi:hypothetical protein